MTKVIAELCQNHKGDRRILQEMIHAAAEAGAAYGKIQSMWVKDLVQRERFELGQTGSDGKVNVLKRPYGPEYERLKSLELSLEDHQWFIEECQRYKLIPLTTLFAAGDIASVAALPWPERLVKVASYDCASYPFLEKLKESFEALFVSTGATTDEEIEAAAKILKGKRFAFFHCVTIYPTPLSECHFARLDYLKKLSGEVGWSDHTLTTRDGLKAAMVASALGADYVERHFTVLKADQTKDGPISVTPGLLRELVQFCQLSESDQMDCVRENIPEFSAMLGRAHRALSAEELLNRDYYRGRFATHKDARPVYNWESEAVSA